MDLSVNVVVEVQVTLHPDGTHTVTSAYTASENPYPFADDFVAWGGDEWLSLSDVNAQNGGLDALESADDEVHKALQALAGLRNLHQYINGTLPEQWPSDPSAADTCDALYRLLGRLGMEVK
jgi:hypothetical protein